MSDNLNAQSVPDSASGLDFIRTRVIEDNKSGRFGGRVHTRFPPEPNGYLHIGHAKSIVLNFGIAEDFGGLCNLRYDDTNPSKESVEYVDSIEQDVRWLGYDWSDRKFYASDYFQKLYDYAIDLTKKGRAYVDSLSADEIAEYRGTPTQPGRESPFRNRSVAENLDLFERMRKGEFPDGMHVLRAKIDMAHPNIIMRDPPMYRIRHVSHHRTGDNWCIYPMYDWAHGLCDSIEGITHSICTLEFEVHRPLYDWFLEALGVYRPQQIEFARLNLTHTVMSKRKLLELVQEHRVSGWNDPRMPTISGLRRRGYTPEAIRTFCRRIGISKTNSIVDLSMLEFFIREDLNKKAQRTMTVLRPLKVVIDNYPSDKVEFFDADNNPEDSAAGTRKVPFANVIYIEEDDFREDPPKKFFRLSPGREVRLKHAYYITCDRVVKDPSTGAVTELHCSYDPESRGGDTPDGRKVKGTLHWVSAAHAVDAEVRLYDHLFTVQDLSEIGEEEDYHSYINPGSLEVLKGCKVEPELAKAKPGEKFQFLRQGYFCVDTVDSKPGAPVFIRTVGLKDSWAKIEKAADNQA
ncbi:MAG TPA: glutamine--tRNA ligase/YqeY domain fusion protein [Spirochaetia bacterium]|nr:glutamine--tRNA ligase/YqeY domain fusion protein [Spirochaetia bacterium]